MLVTADSDPKRIVGILSTRDFIKCVADQGADPRQSRVSEMMSREPVFTYSDTTALHAMTLMNNAGFRHLPVRDRTSGQTIGVISIGDLVRTMMNVFKEKNEFLSDSAKKRHSHAILEARAQGPIGCIRQMLIVDSLLFLLFFFLFYFCSEDLVSGKYPA